MVQPDLHAGAPMTHASRPSFRRAWLLPQAPRLTAAPALAGALALLGGCHGSGGGRGAEALRLAQLGVEVVPAASRAYVHTDKHDAYYYGEAAGPHQSSWQGFNVRGFTFVDDWHWTTPAGPLGSTSFSGAAVFPDHAERRYLGGLTERITLLDGKRALLLEPTGAGPLTLRPLLADSTKAASYEVQALGGALAIARANHLVQAGPDDHPVWLVVKSAGASAAVDGQLVDAGGLKPRMFGPGTLALPAAAPVVLAVGGTLDEAIAAADAVLAAAPQLRAARADRLQGLLDATWVRTEDADFDKAYAWIRLSMDALVMEQQGKGIFAGIPWFNNYWGRDTFISLGGSHLATGRWEEAKEILTAFSAHQDSDSASPTSGRIPNQVSLGGVSYNTADGTPWFVIQARQYLLRSGDAAAATELWPVIERATEGALRHVDALGFLRHGDQETWMDATGPDGPYTPRGDRAVEIQGLFHQQLQAAAAVADQVGQAAAATRYRAADERLSSSFLASYQDAAREELFDKRDASGAPGTQVRPNQFLALRSMADQLPADLVQLMTRSAAGRLAYPHGVASLSPFAAEFHPYHVLPGYYPKDEAYHNGVVWSWLSGPLVSLMASQGAAAKAFQQLEALDDLALRRATIGTLPELLDALPRLVAGSNPPIISRDPPLPAGTPFQAWSHGEYLRNVWEDFLGVRYLSPDHVVLTPGLPPGWGATRARFRVGAGFVRARLTPSAGALDVELTGEAGLPATTVVTVTALGGSQDVTLAAGASRTLRLSGTPPRSGWEGFDWLELALPAGLKALEFPGFIVLDHATIKQGPGGDARTRLTVADPAGDDTGPAGERYTYPTDPHFLPGILDLTGFELREDSGAFYFTLTFASLVQPGWNPGDGFQLTYAAVLLDTHAAVQATEVAHKAGYRLPSGTGFEYAVYVGAGFEVQDAAGHVTALYVPQPADVVDPLGSPDTRAITFRVPKTVIPALPSGTGVTILAGSQDDYGNGSMGDFRAVAGTAGQWVGGGKTVADGPNVYDVGSGTLGP
jgi:glycogen debranching enzyme